MRQVQMIILAGLVLIGPASAQIMQAPRIQPSVPKVPVIVAPVEQEMAATNVDLVAIDPELARKTINKLLQDKRELKLQLSAETARRNEALARIEEMTKPGGSLVRAYCSDKFTSRNTAGAQENCAVTGYACNEVSGLCKTTAASSSDCATGFSWDNNRCVAHPQPE